MLIVSVEIKPFLVKASSSRFNICVKHCVIINKYIYLKYLHEFNLFNTFIIFSAILLNIVIVSMIMFLTCLAGITVFAYYATKGCDPLSSHQIKNANQVTFFLFYSSFIINSRTE